MSFVRGIDAVGGRTLNPFRREGSRRPIDLPRRSRITGQGLRRRRQNSMSRDPCSSCKSSFGEYLRLTLPKHTAPSAGFLTPGHITGQGRISAKRKRPSVFSKDKLNIIDLDKGALCFGQKSGGVRAVGVGLNAQGGDLRQHLFKRIRVGVPPQRIVDVVDGRVSGSAVALTLHPHWPPASLVV